MYVHLDWHVAAHARILLDEIFGEQNFRNEIIWKRTTAHSDSHTWSHVTDMILFYTKSDDFTWNTPYGRHSEEYLDSKYVQVDGEGRRYQLDNLTGPRPPANLTLRMEGRLPSGTLGGDIHAKRWLSSTKRDASGTRTISPSVSRLQAVSR